MDVNEILSGSFLTKDEITEPTPFTIKEAEFVTFDGTNGRPPEKKVQLTFENGKHWTLNKTNTAALARAYTTDAATWVGKPIVVVRDPSVMYAGRLVGGLRVQIPDQNIDEILAADIEEAMADAMSDSA